MGSKFELTKLSPGKEPFLHIYGLKASHFLIIRSQFFRSKWNKFSLAMDLMSMRNMTWLLSTIANVSVPGIHFVIKTMRLFGYLKIFKILSGRPKFWEFDPPVSALLFFSSVSLNPLRFYRSTKVIQLNWKALSRITADFSLNEASRVVSCRVVWESMTFSSF